VRDREQHAVSQWNAEDSSGPDHAAIYITNCKFKNNILCTPEGHAEMIIHYPSGGSASQRELGTTNVFNHNLYSTISGQPEFQAYHTSARQTYASLAAWQASGVSGGDVGSSTGNPLFVQADPHDRSRASAFQLRASSPAINTGEPGTTYQPASGRGRTCSESRVFVTAVWTVARPSSEQGVETLPRHLPAMVARRGARFMKDMAEPATASNPPLAGAHS